MATHVVERVRHELRFRTLEVARVVTLTPRMIRVTFTGADLAAFKSLGPADHVKAFFPPPGEPAVSPVAGPDGASWPGGQRPDSRDYTPRRHDERTGELDIDFVIHGDGPASTWAAKAGPGNTLTIGGPRGSRIVPDDFDYYVLIGDETALPAIGRHLEELPPLSRIFAFVEVADAAEEQPLAARDGVDIHWSHREGAAEDAELLLSALRKATFPPGDGYFFVAGEAGTLRPIRRYLLDELAVPKEWVSISGYWKRGTVNHDHHEPV